jgi:hypothetical protein
VGQLDQFAKDTFAVETATVTHGAVAWQIPPELGMSEVRIDGLLRVLDAAPLVALPAPWSLVGQANDLVLEVKMQGDHLDAVAVERGLLRRQAWQVQRGEAWQAQRRQGLTPPWPGQFPFWMVTSHVPAVLSDERTVEPVAPGCYCVGPSSFPFLWIAANELPLVDELVPFLIARSGRPLDAFARWVMARRPPEWLTRMVELLPMTAAVYDEMLRFVVTKSDDPVINERKRRMVRVLVDTTPEVRQELANEVRQEVANEVHLDDARASLRSVIEVRALALHPEEDARIDACTDLDTLGRWHKQAVVAPSVAEALR